MPPAPPVIRTLRSTTQAGGATRSAAGSLTTSARETGAKWRLVLVAPYAASPKPPRAPTASPLDSPRSDDSGILSGASGAADFPPWFNTLKTLRLSTDRLPLLLAEQLRLGGPVSHRVTRRRHSFTTPWRV